MSPPNNSGQGVDATGQLLLAPEQGVARRRDPLPRARSPFGGPSLRGSTAPCGARGRQSSRSRAPRPLRPRRGARSASAAPAPHRSSRAETTELASTAMPSSLSSQHSTDDRGHAVCPRARGIRSPRGLCSARVVSKARTSRASASLTWGSLGRAGHGRWGGASLSAALRSSCRTRSSSTSQGFGERPAQAARSTALARCARWGRSALIAGDLLLDAGAGRACGALAPDRNSR